MEKIGLCTVSDGCKRSCHKRVNNIRIRHKCEGGIEKSILRITVWHQEACRVMTNGDPEGWIFLCHPHINNGFFFLLTTKCPLFMFKKRLQEVPEYAEMRHVCLCVCLI